VTPLTVRYLQELRLFEATVTPFPMNPEATASAKGSTDDHAADLERLERLEQWAAAATARAVLEFEVEHPEAVAYAAGVHVAAKDTHRLRELERWALSHDYRPASPEEEAARLRQRRWDQADTYDAKLAAWKASVRDCGHRSCMPGACKYRMAS
jgi:hypothetical protein